MNNSKEVILRTLMYNVWKPLPSVCRCLDCFLTWTMTNNYATVEKKMNKSTQPSPTPKYNFKAKKNFYYRCLQ